MSIPINSFQNYISWKPYFVHFLGWLNIWKWGCAKYTSMILVKIGFYNLQIANRSWLKYHNVSHGLLDLEQSITIVKHINSYMYDSQLHFLLQQNTCILSFFFNWISIEIQGFAKYTDAQITWVVTVLPKNSRQWKSLKLSKCY